MCFGSAGVDPRLLPNMNNIPSHSCTCSQINQKNITGNGPMLRLIKITSQAMGMCSDQSKKITGNEHVLRSIQKHHRQWTSAQFSHKASQAMDMCSDIRKQTSQAIRQVLRMKLCKSQAQAGAHIKFRTTRFTSLAMDSWSDCHH